jgi:hypothetical protein
MKKRFTEAQIAGFLRQADAGVAVKHGFSGARRVFDRLAVEHGLPSVLRTDNGPSAAGGRQPRRQRTERSEGVGGEGGIRIRQDL